MISGGKKKILGGNKTFFQRETKIYKIIYMKDRQPYHFPRKDKELISSDTRVNFEPRIKFRNDYSVANRGPSAAFSII